jgi:hypothetical protein
MALPIMRYRTPVDGTPMSDTALWPPAPYEFPALERVQAIKRPNVVSNFQPGKYDPSPAGVSPIYESDCVEGMGRWTAGGVAVTREIDSAILRGIPRLRFRRTAGADGILGTLAASLPSMTFIAIIKLLDITANNAIWGIGSSTSTRSFCYQDTAGRIVHQHGTGDPHTSTGTISLGVFHAFVASFDATSKALRIYVDDATNPLLAATKTNGMPADLNMGVGIAPNLTSPANGEFIHYGTLNTALHLDPAGLAEVMAGLNIIRAL